MWLTGLKALTLVCVLSVFCVFGFLFFVVVVFCLFTLFRIRLFLFSIACAFVNKHACSLMYIRNTRTLHCAFVNKRQTDRQKQTERERETESQTDRQRQTDKQTDRQRTRQTDREHKIPTIPRRRFVFFTTLTGNEKDLKTYFSVCRNRRQMDQPR